MTQVIRTGRILSAPVCNIACIRSSPTDEKIVLRENDYSIHDRYAEERDEPDPPQIH